MKPLLKCIASVAMLVAGIFPLWACGQTFTVSITTNGVVATGTVQIEGAVRTFTSNVGPNGTVTWDIDGCRGSVSGLQPGSPVTIVCKDPLLMQWPDAWTFLGGTWTDTVGGGTGPILMTPAAGYLIEPIHGPLTTEPGHSAYVARLSVGNLGPTTFALSLTFDTHGVDGCVKGLDVAVVMPVASPPFIVPQEGLPLDFGLLMPPDFHVVCLTLPTPAEPAPLATRFRVDSAVPNPFNPRTTLRFELAQAERVRIRIYDTAGRLVRQLVDANYDAGDHTVSWDARADNGQPIASGVYVAQFEAGGSTASARLTLVR